MSTSVTLGPPPAGIGVGSGPGLSRLGVPGGQADASASGDGSVQSEFGGPAVVVELKSVESLRGEPPMFGVLDDASGFRNAAPPLSAPPGNLIPSSSSASVSPAVSTAPAPTTHPPAAPGEATPKAESAGRESESEGRERVVAPPVKVGEGIAGLELAPVVAPPSFAAERAAMQEAQPHFRVESFSPISELRVADAEADLGPVVSEFENATAAERGYGVDAPRFQGLAREPDGGDIQPGIVQDARTIPRLLGPDGVPLGGLPGEAGVSLESALFRAAIVPAVTNPSQSSSIDMQFTSPGALSHSDSIEAQILGGLTPREDAALRQLERSDQIVRSSSAGSHGGVEGMTPAPRHVLVTGPDGRQYAVDGEMQTDVSKLAVEEARIHGRDPEMAPAPALEVAPQSEVKAAIQEVVDEAEELVEANARRDAMVAVAEVNRANELEGSAPSANTTENAARVDALAGFETVDELPLMRSVDARSRVVEGVEVPELRVEDPEPESPNETVAMSSGFVEFLRASQPDVALGASVPMEGDVNVIAGAQTPVQRAYASAETVYEGRGDFVALA